MAVVGAVGGLGRQEDLDRFFKAAVRAGGCSHRRGSCPCRLERPELAWADGSGGWRRGRRGRARARRDCRSGGGRLQGGALGQEVVQRGGAAEGVEGTIADVGVGRGDDFYRVDSLIWSLASFRGWRAVPRDAARTDVAIVAAEGQGELGGQQAVFDAHIVAPVVHFQGQVLFALGEDIERVGEGDAAFGLVRPRFADRPEMSNHHRGEDVHAEETEVVAGAQAGTMSCCSASVGVGFSMTVSMR